MVYVCKKQQLTPSWKVVDTWDGWCVGVFTAVVFVYGVVPAFVVSVR